MAREPFRRAVVIEDDDQLASSLRGHLAARGIAVQIAPGAEAGVRLVREWGPDLVVIDYKLPDGDARKVVMELIGLSEWPTFIAVSGYAEPLDAFELALLGIHAYLPKPVTPASFDAVLERVHKLEVNLVPALRTAVGQMGVRDVEQLARETMVREALARTQGSRSGAARLLRMSRQLLQHVLRGIGS